MRVEYKHLKVTGNKWEVKTISGTLFEFGARISKVKLITPYGNYKEGTIVGVKTNKIKFLD